MGFLPLGEDKISATGAALRDALERKEVVALIHVA